MSVPTTGSCVTDAAQCPLWLLRLCPSRGDLAKTDAEMEPEQGGAPRTRADMRDHTESLGTVGHCPRRQGGISRRNSSHMNLM